MLVVVPNRNPVPDAPPVGAPLPHKLMDDAPACAVLPPGVKTQEHEQVTGCSVVKCLPLVDTVDSERRSYLKIHVCMCICVMWDKKQKPFKRQVFYWQPEL